MADEADVEKAAILNVVVISALCCPSLFLSPRQRLGNAAIPLLKACKVKKPRPRFNNGNVARFPYFLAGMRTLTQQVYEDRAAACSRTAEQTDDPVFRRMLLMLGLQWKLAAQEETSKSGDICRREARAPGLNSPSRARPTLI